MTARKLTVVTGGTRGIGAATALRLAADDATAEATSKQVEDAGARCRTVRADVTDPEQVEALFDAAAEAGPVTGLVNNAGATLHIGELVDTPTAVIRRVIDLNLTAAVLCARRALRDMIANGAGTIVNVSSGAATLGAPGEYVHYAAAKAGVDTLTKGLAVEAAPYGVRVNAVAPGIIRTGIHEAAGEPGRLERVAPNVPMGRVGEPEEVAAAITWLLGDECPYATGAVLRVAGGR